MMNWKFIFGLRCINGLFDMLTANIHRYFRVSFIGFYLYVLFKAIYRGGERERPYSSGGAPPPPAEPATRTVTMSRDPADSHGFGICVKGGKEAGESNS
jgi:hypothetical protein